MASTYSDLKIELIGTGEQAGTWGATTNTNLGTALEEAIVGRATANFTTDADLTLTLTNVNTTQVARHYILNVTSGVSLSTTRNLIVPSIDKPYIIENNTTGGRSIIVKTAAGTGVTVPNGKDVMVYANSVNVVSAINHIPELSLTTDLAVADGGTGASDAAGARTNLGVTATGADTTYAFRANNLSDLANAGTARTNLGVTATGADTTYAFRSNNLSDLANAGTARTNLGLGTIATQAANNVAITGGSITGITDLTVADGGTGRSTLAANNVLLGNGTSGIDVVAPGTSGNVLSSNGTTWTSSAPQVSNSNFTGTNQSLTTEGYQKLPGGLIIQWGTCSSGVAKTFALAFPTSCLNVTATINNTNAEIRVSNVSATGFTAFTNQNGFNANFLAIGF